MNYTHIYLSQPITNCHNVLRFGSHISPLSIIAVKQNIGIQMKRKDIYHDFKLKKPFVLHSSYKNNSALYGFKVIKVILF